MLVALRRYSRTDSTGCYNVFFNAVHNGTAPYYNAAQRHAWVPTSTPPVTWAQRLGDQVCWVAVNEDEIVGFMTLESDGHLDLAYVAPEYRRTGVAPSLYEKIETDAKRLELSRIFSEASHLARPFFLKHGWVVTSPETVTRAGVEIARFQMAKDL